jgi:hypothetical protein
MSGLKYGSNLKLFSQNKIAFKLIGYIKVKLAHEYKK